MKILFLVLLVCCIFVVSVFGFSSNKLSIGSIAPNFKLLDQDNQYISLSDYRNKKNVVLYFYPKDFTPGCTSQACSLRNGYDELLEHDIEVLGVSFDTVEKHKKFAKAKNLQFKLLSDGDKAVAKAYGAVRSTFGLYFPIPKRITFLINKDGRIVSIINNISLSSHSDQVLASFGFK